MRVIVGVFVLLTSFFVNAQEKGDVDYVFTSLEEAMERPEIVYHLDLSKNKLEIFPENLSQFINLKTLDLSKNKISLIPASVGELETLEKLNLERNKIFVIPPQVKNLKKLEELLLARNDIEEVPREVGEITSLKKLDLWSNNVKRVDPAIQNLKQLEVIDLQGMLLENELKKNLMEWFPEAEVRFSGGCDCGF